MTCTANGYPPPRFTITKEGVNVQTNVQPGIHIIDNVQLGDDGKEFSCTPTNQKGSGPAKEFKLVVIGKVTPYVTRQDLLKCVMIAHLLTIQITNSCLWPGINHFVIYFTCSLSLPPWQSKLRITT